MKPIKGWKRHLLPSEYLPTYDAFNRFTCCGDHRDAHENGPTSRCDACGHLEQHHAKYGVAVLCYETQTCSCWARVA